MGIKEATVADSLTIDYLRKEGDTYLIYTCIKIIII